MQHDESKTKDQGVKGGTREEGAEKIGEEEKRERKRGEKRLSFRRGNGSTRCRDSSMSSCFP
jgi:hypothetical protein